MYGSTRPRFNTLSTAPLVIPTFSVPKGVVALLSTFSGVFKAPRKVGILLMSAFCTSRPFNAADVATEVTLLTALIAASVAAGLSFDTNTPAYVPAAEVAKLIPSTLAKLSLLTVPVATLASVIAVVFISSLDNCSGSKPIFAATFAIVSPPNKPDAAPNCDTEPLTAPLTAPFKAPCPMLPPYAAEVIAPIALPIIAVLAIVAAAISPAVAAAAAAAPPNSSVARIPDAAPPDMAVAAAIPIKARPG